MVCSVLEVDAIGFNAWKFLKLKWLNMTFFPKGLSEFSRGKHTQTAKARMDRTTIKIEGKCWLHQARFHCQGWFHVTYSVHDFRLCMCNIKESEHVFQQGNKLVFSPLSLYANVKNRFVRSPWWMQKTKQFRLCICSDVGMLAILELDEKISPLSCSAVC